MSTRSLSPHATGIGRREFLGTLSATGAALCGTSALGPLAAIAQPDVSLPDQFGRMFRLPPFAPPTNAVRDALLELGKPDGLMDAQDDLDAGPVDLIVKEALNTRNRNSLQHTAGLTFFGQFLDHDITFDTQSRLGFPSQPIHSPNGRSPFFDLDSVYASGPEGSRELYEASNPLKFKIQSGGLFEDLPRNGLNNAAIIGDPRNDENLIIAGLHAAFLRFHNRAVDQVQAEDASLSGADAFAAARQLATWHYQWLILHEFLPAVVEQATIDDVLQNGRRLYNPRRDEAFIPIEFQIAYRFGHSMVRPSYRANMKGDDGNPFFAMIFDPKAELPDPVDLRGGARARRRFVGWQTFFDFGGVFTADKRPNKKIDTKISTPLFRLPLGAIASGTPPTSLMQRNMLRHLTWQLPSGQTIAAEMGAPQLAAADLQELRAIRESFVGSTPLLYYVLKEAEVMMDGNRLGPVGGQLIAEVFIGLLQLDPNSYLNVQPSWVPTLPAKAGRPETFRMTDLLTFAEVDPESRGQ